MERLYSIQLLIISLLFFSANPAARAVPASPAGWEITQPDGTRFELHLRGDEFFSWHETADGYAVVKDAGDGFWKYALPATNRAEFAAIPRARVGSATPAALNLQKHALPEARLLRAHVQARRQALDGTATAQSAVQSAAQTATNPAASGNPTGVTVSPAISVAGTKTVRNIVILACFSNYWDAANGTVYPTNGITDVSAYSNLLNQIGYTNNGAAGSLKDYYREVSYGKLTVDSIVTPWVRLPHEEAYYGNNTNGDAAQMAADAIAAASAAGFDFSQGDTDGDGWVDCLDIIHSGYDEAQGGGDNAVWSIKGSMHNVVTASGVKMYNFHTEPALWGNSGTNLTRIGTICHETGHFFGLPDLYDTAYQTDGLGSWCIMSYGVYNGGGAQPAHFSAWCKDFLGFTKPTAIHSLAGVSLPRVEDHPVVGMIRDGLANGEYFLVENRENVGFDNTPQIYPGLLIYHVYSQSPGNNSTSCPHPEVRLEEADGNDSTGFPETATSQPTDPWTSTNGLATGFCDQTGNKNTSAMAYQSTFYYRTNAPASYSYNRLSNFSAASNTMTFDVQTLKTAPASQSVPAPAYVITWPPCSQATQYEIQEGSAVTLTNFTDGAEDENAMYENWYIGGKVERITTSGYTGSCCYAMLSSGSSVQSLTLQQPFLVTTSTVISFYLMSHVVSGDGVLKCELSNNGGNTWKTLGAYSNFIDPWSVRSYNAADITAAGINNGDQCLLRLAADIEYTYGWGTFPAYGFAVDAISITGTGIAGCGNWTSLASNLTTNQYPLTGKTNGVYAYRVQAFANGAWQGFGPASQTTVNLSPVAAFSSPTNGAVFIAPATLNLAATVASNNTTTGNIRFYNGTSLLQTFSAPPCQYTWTGVTPGNYTLTAQVDYNGGATATSAPVNITVTYQPPVLASDTATTAQNTPVTIPVLANDTDPYNLPLALLSVTQPARGGAVMAGTNVVYTPNDYTYGTDSFGYTAGDGLGPAASATVSVTTHYPNYPSMFTNAMLNAGPVAYWRLNETSGTRAMDSAGSYHGTNAGSLVLGVAGPGAPLFPGLEAANTAYQFSSNSSAGTSVAIPALNLNTNTVTITAWVNSYGTQGYYPGIFSWQGSGSARGQLLFYNGNSELCCYWSNSFQVSPFYVPTNQWTFVALAISPSNTVFYLATNSALAAWTNSVANPASAFNSTAYLGTDPFGHFNGAIDEVAVFNRTLSLAQISELLVAAQTARPAVTLNQPAGGSGFAANENVALAATVATNGNHVIDQVQFFTNATLLAATAVPPYACTWSNAAAGSYAVLARVIYDGAGSADSSPATIAITNLPPATVTAINFTTGGSVTLNVSGGAGQLYHVQRATNLLSGWTTLWSTNAPAAGAFIFTDSFGDLGTAPRTAYYRLSW